MPAAEGSTIEGSIFREVERLVIYKPFFIFSRIILEAYMLVIVIVYFRRPGKYLPHMPTTIAAVTTFSAASAAVEDFRGTSHFGDKDNMQLLDKQKYAYGSYVGRIGKVHVGVEILPFVIPNEGRTYTVMEDASSKKQWARYLSS